MITGIAIAKAMIPESPPQIENNAKTTLTTAKTFSNLA